MKQHFSEDQLLQHKVEQAVFESSNEITINILPELNTGGILANQVICENTQPADLNLNGATSGAGVTYQWEQSIDSDNWTDYGGRGKHYFTIR